jgi:hypothetical protein
VRLLSAGWKPRIVPYGADQTVYLVVDRFGQLGSVYRETEVEHTDLETIIADLMSGQFNDPLRVVAFNTLEHWSDDWASDKTRQAGSVRSCMLATLRVSERDHCEHSYWHRLNCGLAHALPAVSSATTA